MPWNNFTIATFNVKNLVNADTPYYPKPDGSSLSISPENLEFKTNWLAEQLFQMNADHVCLQEVFHEEALRKVVKKYHDLVEARGVNRPAYRVVKFFENEDSVDGDPRPGLAYLGRGNILDSYQIQNFPDDPIVVENEDGSFFSTTKTGRPIAVVKVDLGAGLEGFIINAHLKSKRPIFPEGSAAEDPSNMMYLDRAKAAITSLVIRAGESLALRRECLKLSRDTGTPIFLAGDLNDSATAVTTEILKGEHDPYDAPGDVIEQFQDVVLHSAANEFLRRSEKSDFTTHIHQGQHSTLDHIFYSREFHEVDKCLPKHEKKNIGNLNYVRAYNDHLIDKSHAHAPKERDATDHGQIVARFSFES